MLSEEVSSTAVFAGGEYRLTPWAGTVRVVRMPDGPRTSTSMSKVRRLYTQSSVRSDWPDPSDVTAAAKYELSHTDTGKSSNQRSS